MPASRSSGNTGRAIDNSGCLIPFGGIFAVGGAAIFVSRWVKGPTGSPDAGLQLMMALIVGAVGVLLVVWGVAGRRVAQRAAALRIRNPDQPWLWRTDWVAGAVEVESKSQSLTYVLMGILCVLVSAPALLNFNRELFERHNRGILAALLFPLVGLYLIGHALLGRVRTRKFRAIFRMAQNPGVAGGRLRGRIESAFPLPPGEPVDLTLSCVRSSAPSGDRDRGEEVLWQDKVSAAATLGPLGGVVPVDFAIPFDVRETDPGDSAGEILWRLTAARELVGVDFNLSFQVPVFKTSASDPSITAQKMEDDAQAHVTAIQPTDSKIRAGAAPSGGMQFYLGPARNKRVATALLVFGLIFAASGLLFVFLIHGAIGWIIGAIPLVLGVGVGALLFALSLSLWLSTTTLTVAKGELRINSAFLGVARTRIVRSADIQRFELYAGMRSSNQVWYDLRLYLTNGRKVTAASGMEKREAQWLLAEVKRSL